MLILCTAFRHCTQIKTSLMSYPNIQGWVGKAVTFSYPGVPMKLGELPDKLFLPVGIFHSAGNYAALRIKKKKTCVGRRPLKETKSALLALSISKATEFQIFLCYPRSSALSLNRRLSIYDIDRTSFTKQDHAKFSEATAFCLLIDSVIVARVFIFPLALRKPSR